MLKRLEAVGDTLEDSVLTHIRGQVDRLKDWVRNVRSYLAGFPHVKIEKITIEIPLGNYTLTQIDIFNFTNHPNVTKFYSKPNISSENPLDSIKEGVETEIRYQTKTLRNIISTLNTVLPFTMILLFLQAFFYYRGYTRRVEYDNIYISHKFKEIDRYRKSKGKKSILPLRFRERGNLIDSTSLCLSRREAKEFFVGLLIFIIFFIVGAFLILADYGLYITLDIISRHANTSLTVTGGTGFQINLPNGSFSPNLRLWLKEEFPDVFESNSTMLDYQSVAETERCLPNPELPFLANTPGMVKLCSLYVAVFILTVLQSYGLRAQHKIAGYFYKEQARKRITYLYHTLLTQRVTFSQLLIRKFKGIKSEDQSPHFEDWLAAKCHCLGKLMRCFGVARVKTCISCATKDHLRQVGDEWCCEDCLSDSQKDAMSPTLPPEAEVNTTKETAFLYPDTEQY